MTVVVTTEGEAPTPVADAPPDSPLADLRGLYRKFQEALSTDLEVPHWREIGYPVFVRYGLPDMDRAAKRAEDKTLTGTDANCDILVNACIGIYMEMPDGAKLGLTSGGDPTLPWPRFDEALARALGMEGTTAIGVCKALYGRGTDDTVNGAAINIASNALLAWAGSASSEARRGFLES